MYCATQCFSEADCERANSAGRAFPSFRVGGHQKEQHALTERLGLNDHAAFAGLESIRAEVTASDLIFNKYTNVELKRNYYTMLIFLILFKRALKYSSVRVFVLYREKITRGAASSHRFTEGKKVCFLVAFMTSRHS
jgi:hypothetical protein